MLVIGKCVDLTQRQAGLTFSKWVMEARDDYWIPFGMENNEVSAQRTLAKFDYFCILCNNQDNGQLVSY